MSDVSRAEKERTQIHKEEITSEWSITLLILHIKLDECFVYNIVTEAFRIESENCLPI